MYFFKQFLREKYLSELLIEKFKIGDLIFYSKIE